MKKLSIPCMALAAIIACGQTAKAAPVSTALTLTTDSGVNLVVSTLGGFVSSEVPIPVDLIGTIEITLDDAIDDLAGTNDATSVSLDDAAIDLSDASFFLNLHFYQMGAVSGLGINSITSNGGIGLTTTSPTDPFTSTFDPGGGSPTELSIDEGIFTYLGIGAFGDPWGFVSADFAVDPVSATVSPVGQIGLVTQDVTVTGNTIVVDVVVSAPLSFSYEIPVLNTADPGDPILNINLDYSGALVATGSYTTIVPEPSTLVLLGIAIAGMIPLWRRLRG